MRNCLRNSNIYYYGLTIIVQLLVLIPSHNCVSSLVLFVWFFSVVAVAGGVIIAVLTVGIVYMICRKHRKRKSKGKL